MANPEHLKILKQGVEVWNRWKMENDIDPDLSETNLAGMNLFDVDFEFTNLSKSDLSNANLECAGLAQANFRGAILCNAELRKVHCSGADFSYADLRSTDFFGTFSLEINFCFANMSGCNFESVDMSEANFSHANLSGSNLDKAALTNTNLAGVKFNNCSLFYTNFTGSKFAETDFSEATLYRTVFGQNNLATCIGLDKIKASSDCIFDFHTLRASRNLPKSFLLKIGLPENYINYLPDFFDENPIRMYPVFLSHSWQNKEFANKLYEALIARGVQVWYDEKKMKPGDDIYESLSRGIEVYDKMILVCSKESLGSWWVDREIGRILEKERKLLKEKGKKAKLLIPIKIDDHIHDWDGGKKTEILDLKIGDFRHWQDEAKFQKALDELIAALNVDRGEDAPPSFL